MGTDAITGLSADLTWLVWTLIMTALFWVPYILNRLQEQGVLTATLDPQGDKTTDRPWAKRMMQAHSNAVENLVIFAPLVFLVELTGKNSETTAMACAVYFFARLAHYLVYTFGIPVIRSILFVVGFAAQLVLAGTLLGW